MTEKRHSAVGVVGWIGVAVGVCLAARRLGIGDPSAPGPGFMLFWSGVVTGGLGFALFLRRRARYDAGESGEDRNNTTRIVQAVGLLGLYVFLFEAVGFHVTTAFMTAGIVALAGERRWSRVLTFAGAATIGTYILLELWLGLRLPTGVLDVR